MSESAAARNSMLRAVPGVLRRRSGLPRVDWSRLNRWLARTYRGDGRALARAYRRAEQEFVAELAAALNIGRGGSPYRLTAAGNFDLLSAARPATLDGLIEFAEQARRIILRSLKGVADDSGYGAHVVLLFTGDEDYDRYAAGYARPVGGNREAETVGFYTNDGFGHFAIRHTSPARTRRILAHELVHACMQHLPAPDWLHEGCACMLERALVRPGAVDSVDAGKFALPEPRSLPGKTWRRRLGAYWNAPGASRRTNRSDFWSGRGFYAGGSAGADRTRENCFALAEGLVAWLFARNRSAFLRFAGGLGSSGAGRPSAGRAELAALLGGVADPVDFFLKAPPLAL